MRDPARYRRLRKGLLAAAALGALTLAPGPGTIPAAAQTRELAGAADLPPTPQGVVPDALFTKPYIDKDEDRTAPFAHRYVHGGFAGTDLRFSFYFPARERYEGRFFQYVTPVPDSENLAQGVARDGDGDIGFALNHGGYYIETNGGGASATSGPGLQTDPTVGAFRANAAAAQFSRVVAQRLYGGKRPYGYIWGGSGGAYRTIGSIENTQGVWDGAVPFVMGSPMASPYNFTAPLYANRVLGSKWPQVIDALEVGGSGDPYADLSREKAAALREILRFGYPIPELRALARGYVGAFPVLYPGMLAADPSYFTDFWTKPGYEGFDPPPSLRAALVEHKTRIVRLVMANDAEKLGLKLRPQMGQARGTAELAWQALVGPDGHELPVAIEIESALDREVGSAADLRILSGAAQGQLLRLQRIEGRLVVLQKNDAAVLANLKPGDALQVDNRNWLAAQTYHRHQVPGPGFHTWDQFRKPDGTPIYPQRPKLLGPEFARGAAGSVPSGSINAKVIVVENLSDSAAWPWHADWYRARVSEHLGKRTDANFRLWYTEHAEHGGPATAELVTFTGLLQQALLDVSAWVERGVAPPPNTAYRMADGQVTVPATARERRGIQPVVHLRANGAVRAEAAAGTPVRLSATIEVPEGAGKVVGAEWDLGGDGSFVPATGLTVAADGSARVSLDHAFPKPGTVFVGLRATAQRAADAGTPYAKVMNLGRVRVVVR